ASSPGDAGPRLSRRQQPSQLAQPGASARHAGGAQRRAGRARRLGDAGPWLLRALPGIRAAPAPPDRSRRHGALAAVPGGPHGPGVRMSEGDAPLIQLSGIVAGYADRPVLDGVDLTLRAGERMVLLG